jgi:hypothetical protein
MAVKAGRKAEARHLLEMVLDADERNEQAWLWMSGVVDSDDERIVCLENVLTINPNNQAARQGLAAFGVTSEIDQLPRTAISEGPSTEPPVAPAPASTIESIDVDELPLDDPTTPDRRSFIAITLILVLMLICTVISIVAIVILSPPW